MIVPNGQLVITRIPLPLGGYREEYRLMKTTDDGLAWSVASPRDVSGVLLDAWTAPGFPEFVAVGPYQFRFLERHMTSGGAVYIPYLPFSRFRVLLYRSTRWMDGVYRRLILTAHVWGLATYGYGTAPSWRDLKIVTWLQKKIKRGD